MRKNERVVVVGATGSGKTFTALWLLRLFYKRIQILIINTSDDEQIHKLDGIHVTKATQLTKYRFPQNPLLIYTPEASENNPVTLDSVLQWVYLRKNTFVYIDEGTNLNDGVPRPKEGFLNCYTRGRRRNVGMMFATQRPVNVPLVVFTEAEWVFLHNLRRQKDRVIVADYTDDAMLPPVTGHNVRIFHAGEGVIYEGDVKKW